ncbi:MAG: hypothetical protein MRY83_05570 [Flavobacteriales bacterium]|nr:hypothetical protein [Flavobacteriales bacterium]
MGFVNTKFLWSHYLCGVPKLYGVLTSLFNHEKPGQSKVSTKTKIVIDGFPRSANTYAHQAFLESQGDGIQQGEIAHHIHKSYQIIEGVKRNIPVILLIRNPKDAVLSLVIRQPKISIKTALKSYIVMHKQMLPYISSIIVSDFSQTISEFDKVLENVNDKYSSAFKVFENDTLFQEKIKKQIENRKEALKGTNNTIALPNKAKHKQKEILEKELGMSALLNEATEIYQKVLATSG